MLIAVRNIKLTCECHKAIKLNYKNTRTRVIVVLRLPSTLRRPQLVWSTHAKVTALQCLVVAQAHWTSMTSRTAYSTSTSQKPTHFSGHYLPNRSTLDIGVLGFFGIVQHKEHPPEVWSVPPVTPCILGMLQVTLWTVKPFVHIEINLNTPLLILQR